MLLHCLLASGGVNKRPDGLVVPGQACKVQSPPTPLGLMIAIPTDLVAVQPYMNDALHIKLPIRM